MADANTSPCCLRLVRDASLLWGDIESKSQGANVPLQAMLAWAMQVREIHHGHAPMQSSGDMSDWRGSGSIRLPQTRDRKRFRGPERTPFVHKPLPERWAMIAIVHPIPMAVFAQPARCCTYRSGPREPRLGVTL